MAQRALQTKVASADALVVTGDCEFCGFVATPDGTNALTFALYDGVSTSGTKKLPTMTFAGNGGTQAFSPHEPIHCPSGIYADVTLEDGAAEYAILYRKY